MLCDGIIFLLLFQISVCYSQKLTNVYKKDEGVSAIPKHLVLQIIEQASEIQCLHWCRRNELCKTIAYNQKSEMCKLLKGAPDSTDRCGISRNVDRDQIVFQFADQGMIHTR